MITNSCIHKKGVILLCLLFPFMLTAQTTHIWTGEFGDSWSTAGNWDTDTAPTDGDSLIFVGNVSYVHNDYSAVLPPTPGYLNTGLHVHNITINSTAEESFIIDGNRFRIGGTITNNTDYEVIINQAIHVINAGGNIPGGNSAGLLLDVGAGGMSIYGDITLADNNRNFAKQGTGTLTLSGGNTYQTGQRFSVRAGELIFDAATLSNSASSSHTRFGGLDGTAMALAASAILRFDNGSTGTLGFSITLEDYSGANKLIIENGSTISFGNEFGAGTILRNGDANYTTLNIDVSNGGQFLHAGDGWLEDTGPGSNRRGFHTTLTELVGGVKKTGFAYAHSGVVGRVTTVLDDLPVSGYGNHASYKTSGHFTATTAAGLGSGSLTIMPTAVGDGTGSLNTSTVGSIFWFQAVLMEEGTKDYTITYVDMRGGHDRTFHVHQYSTDGTLRFMGFLNINGAVVKTGPGTVWFSNAGVDSLHNGGTDVQGGHFILDSNFVRTSHFYVRGEDAILSGSGKIGGGSNVHTQVQILDGGTLEANRHAASAFDISGSLTLRGDGNYRMELHESMAYDPLTVLGTGGDTPQAALVTLAGNLELSLYYGFGLEEEAIILLRTDGSITGVFDSINSSSFINGNQFFLTYNSADYWFQIDYQYDLGGGFTAIALHAIPEPSTIALILGGALLGFLCIRRRALSDNR